MADPHSTYRAPVRLGSQLEAGSLTSALSLALAACALLVLLASLEFRTTRSWWDEQTGTGSSWSEGAARWAWLTFLAGAATLGLLLAGLLAGTAWRAPFSALAAVTLAVATFHAGKNWRRLLDERDEPREYALQIAVGLPVVTLFGAIGAFVAVTLAVLWLGRAVRKPAGD